MAQCAHCQTPYEKGQRYCSVCGSFLLHPEEGDTFCPQCEIRVSPRQEFCHECDVSLKGAPAAVAALSPEPSLEPVPPAGPPAKGMQPWIMGLAICAGIIIVFLLIMLFSRGAPTPTPPAAAPKAEAPAPPTSTPPAKVAEPAPAPAPELKEQLQSVLAALREGQLKKDIVIFMNAYSLTFPELDQKRANTLKSWEDHDYTNLVFTVDKLQNIDPDNAVAWVTWYVDTRNRRTQELASATQTYQVRFAREMGKWRIRSLQEME